MNKINLKLKRLSNKFLDIPLPSYATEGSSGMDVRAAIESDIIIEPGKLSLIPTDFSVEIPFGYEIQVRPRSGLAVKHSIGVLNSPGTIDSDYRGEVKIILMNFGNENFTVKKSERIAQLVLAKVHLAEIEVVDDLQDSSRGQGGFGHTGKN